jgi:MoaA/NifB/PqqE/SkfB family radical SAM enzyme
MVENYRKMMDDSLKSLFRDALQLSRGNLDMRLKILRVILHQRKAAATRGKWHKKGIEVPPFMINSITGTCNLRCKGCYAMKEGRLDGKELPMERIEEIYREAGEMGVSAILIAGGEPLVRRDILKVTQKFPSMVFPVFTNGTLVDDDIVNTLQHQKNVVPVISLEGYEEDTDNRRGEGVFRRLTQAMDKLGSSSIFYGASLTVTCTNIDTLTCDNFVEGLIKRGCRLLFYVEYVPVREGTEDWVLTEAQREKLADTLARLRTRYPALFISFPGDEKEFGGCLASGRGFVHINKEGGLEPCPFAPYSDISLRDTSLKQAIKSDFLATIRENHDKLKETSGGCALWDNREWVQSILVKQDI